MIVACNGPGVYCFIYISLPIHVCIHEFCQLAALYCAQRGELTKLVDTDMDWKADVYETVYAWPITGNYHEYSYGPKIAPDGSFFVTLNGTCPPFWWHMQSNAPWRG